MNDAIYAIGLMSGTSCDGVDAALVKTDGVTIDALGSSCAVHYTPDIRQELLSATIRGAASLSVEEALTHVHIEVVEKLIASSGIEREAIKLIGFHGQTILHNPKEGVTHQIGLPALLAQETGIDVVADFRSNDVRHGGEGAPLVPIFHQALFTAHTKPLAVVNIGGVGNVTYLDGSTMLAFDTGPGNALMDDWMVHHHALNFDDSGDFARSFTVDDSAVEALIDDNYFKRKPPKSLDRNHFNRLVEPLSKSDSALATLLECTVQSIVAAQKHFPKPVASWWLSGGGRHNRYLVERLQSQLTQPVHLVEEAGFDGDMIEAQAFAYLAVRSRYQLPLTFPTTTGVTEAMLGGVFYPA